MAHILSKKNSLSRKTKHWAQRVRESIVCKGPEGSFNLKIVGGAENGEFISIGDLKEDKVVYKKGKLFCEDIILEINQEPVAGYTRPDVLTLINKDGGDAASLRTVKPGHGITRDLRQFLAGRFDKVSLDSDLQQTIRENLYRRTVPCTTRSPRDGEMPGVDYVFLNMDEFIKMEKSGALLESGIYDGNHYGTPKPPRLPTGTLNSSQAAKRKGRPSSATKWERQNTSMDASRFDGRGAADADHLGSLSCNWEVAYTESNEKYFINHKTGTTQWVDPRLSQMKKSKPEECNEDELPYGWERVEDPKYGTYYIDHLSRKTQFENPVTAARRTQDSQKNSYYDDNPSSFSQPPPHMGPPNFSSTAALAKAQEAEAMSRWPQVDFDHSQPPAYTAGSHTYPMDSRQLEGEVIRTVLLKGYHGFGFTIIGGDQPGELLQIKSIVEDGAAAKDGKLRTGDALAKVNGRPVLNKTHQEVVGLFQSMPKNEEIELEMIRGYPLPFDPNDPNVETIGSYTVVRSPQGRAGSPNQSGLLQPGTKYGLPNTPSDQSLASSSNASGIPGMARHNQSMGISGPADSPITPKPGYSTGTFPRTSTTTSLPRSTSEIHYVRIVKGPMGFGFTIADSPYGQRIKQILDARRCERLMEGDILVEINGRQIRSRTHNEAVEILKNCQREKESVMVIQRGGIPTPLKNSPVPLRREQEMDPAGHKPRSKSTPPMGMNAVQVLPPIPPQSQRTGSLGNLATSGESTRNQETGSGQRANQPYFDKSADALVQSYPSLRKAVASAQARRSQDHLNQSDPAYSDIDMSVTLRRGENGFGFRIVGGYEEGTQVAIATIVSGSPAALDGRLYRGDEILYVDGVSVIDAKHQDVISLMKTSAMTGQVTLGIRRRQSQSGRTTPSGTRRSSNSVGITSRSAGDLTEFGSRDEYERGFRPTQSDRASNRDRRRSESDMLESDVSMEHRDVMLSRGPSEGFGFVILSSVHKSGSTIGRIIQGSPADRCRQLFVGDKLVAVNGVSIVGMHHSDIVNNIKQSGMRVTLRISQKPLDNEETKMLSHRSAPDIARANAEGYMSDREQDVTQMTYRRQQELLQRQREDQRRLEEEEALARERERREREETRIQEEMRREEEIRREEEMRREEELKREEEMRQQEEMRREEEMKREEEMRRQEEMRREERKREDRREAEQWEAKRREEERRQAEKKEMERRREEEQRREEELQRQEQLRRDEEIRREEARKREEERRWEEERRREEEKRWEQEREEDRRWEDEKRRRVDLRGQEDMRRQPGMGRSAEERRWDDRGRGPRDMRSPADDQRDEMRRQDDSRWREDGARRQDERRRYENTRREDEPRRREEEEAMRRRDEIRQQEEMRRREDKARRHEEMRRREDEARKQEEMRRREDEARKQEEMRRREDEARKQEEMRRREDEARKQEEMRRREDEARKQEEMRRRENEARKQEELQRHLQEEAKRQEERRRQENEREEELRRREEEQARQRAQDVRVRPQPPKKVPPPVLPKPSKTKVLQARGQLRESGYTTLPGRTPPPQQDKYRRLSGSDMHPAVPAQGLRQRGKSESELLRDSRTGEVSQVMDIELFRKNQGYGFSIRGGRELDMPIFVLRIADGGIAAMDGRLKVGDQLLEINNRSTVDLLHTDAIGMIRSGGRVKLNIKRGGNPPLYDGVPNGDPQQNVSRTEYSRSSRETYQRQRPLSYY